MQIENIKNIKNSKIRIFPFQTSDHTFILYADLQVAYLLTLLIDRLEFQLDQFVLDYIYPFDKYTYQTIENIHSYEEDYFIFYLENYFHSSGYALGFVETLLDKIEKQESKPKIIIHTLKTPVKECVDLINKYSCITFIVNCDLEYFFNEIFYKKTSICDIPNILFRDDEGNVYVNKIENITEKLDDYIIGAYHSGYYANFSKSKDYIISLVDEDDEDTDENSYYRWPKEKYVKAFRYLPETQAMLTTGRGCKYNCSYCYRGSKYAKVRTLSLETLKKDLDHLKGLHYQYIYFYDDCFITTNIDRLEELVCLLSQYDFYYGISARYEVCTFERLELLSQLRIERVQIGLQSISIDVNKETRRGFNQTKFNTTILRMRELGISVSLDIIMGLPGEGVKWFLKTFNYAITLKPTSIYINTLFLNPGTHLYENQENYGIVTYKDKGKASPFHVSGIYSSDNFSVQDIQLARKYVTYYMNKIKDIDIILR